MNAANESAAPVSAPAKEKAAKLSFSKDYGFDVALLGKSLEKMRGDMGRYKELAKKHGLVKSVRDMSGDAHAIVTPEMGAKLRAAGHITAMEAENIRAFSGAIKALEVIASYDTRKAAALAKLK